MNISKTKTSTSAEYSRRINKVLEFIDNHIDQVIRLDDLANVSYFSAYHFHRIFHAMVGETVNDYVSRKRMEKAAYRLIGNTGSTITDIAELGGFSSSANFSKAFKLYFGVSPSELRKPNGDHHRKIGKIYRKYGKAFNPSDLYPQLVTNELVFDPDKLKEMLMKVKIKEMPLQPIAYLSSPKGYELDAVHATWDKISNWANTIGISKEQQTNFAFCHDNPTITPEDKCRYDAAIIINPDTQVTEPYTRSTIPAGKYAVAYYKDDSDKIPSFMTELCSQWLCESGYEPDDHPPMFNYLNDAREDGFVEMDIYIKLKELAAVT